MFFRTIVAAIGVIFLGLLAILLWPRSRLESAPVDAEPLVHLPEPVPAPVKVAPRRPPALPPQVAMVPPPVDAGRPEDQMEQVESCAGKPCGTPCLFRCDPEKDYANCQRAGVRSGQCNAQNECTILVPPVCPGR